MMSPNGHPPPVRVIDPYHHFGGIVLSSRHARLDAPTLRVWVQAPEVLPWPRVGHLWRETVVKERAPLNYLSFPPPPATLGQRVRAAWRALTTDRYELLT